MSIVTIPGGLIIPSVHYAIGAPVLSFVGSMTASGHKVAYIFQAPKTGNIRKVIWGTRSITSGSGTVDVRVETLDETVTPATPSGTLFGTNTNGSQSVVSTDDNVTFTTTLTADAAVTAGDNLAVVIVWAGTLNGQFLTALAAPSGTRPWAFPYATAFGASWAVVASVTPMLALEYSDGTYEPINGVYPTCASITTHTIGTGTTPDVVGLRFQLAFPARVKGIWATVNCGGDYAVRLVTTAYNQGAATGILASVVRDKDTRASTPSPQLYMFATPQNISKNTNYRAIIEPTTATTIDVYSLPVASAAQQGAWMAGSNFITSTAKDPTGDGDWTNLNSGTFAAPFIGLIIDGFDDELGAGGTGGQRAYAFSG